MSAEEVAVIFDFLEKHYGTLVGNCKTITYCQDRKKEWTALVNAVNGVHDNRYNRTAKRISKWIENLRTKGRFYLDFDNLTIFSF